MRGVVDVTPGAATFDANGACRWIDADTLHAREVDHQAIVTGAQARAIVPATAHRQRQLVLAGEVDRGDDVGDIDAAGDQRGSLVDHAVVDL